MKRSAILLICLFALLPAPAMVSAQHLYGSMPPGPPVPLGIPGMPGLQGGCPPPCPPACPPPGCPPPCPPMPGCQSSCIQILGPSVYVGYVFSDDKGFSYQRQAADGSATPNLTYRSPLQGVYLAGAGGAALSDRISVMGTGGALILPKVNGNMRTDGATATPLTGSLTSQNYWWFLDGAAQYGLFGQRECGMLEVVGGVRLDQFGGKQDLDFGNSGGATAVVGNTENELKVQAWMPYFGLQLSQYGCDANYTVRVIGFPALYGNLNYQDNVTQNVAGTDTWAHGSFSRSFRSGYFMEFLAEYSQKVSCDFSIGAFVKSNVLRGETRFDDYIDALHPPDSERIIVDRQAWTVGGTASLNFKTF